MEKPKISLFIITKNEARHIRACIESARSLVQEIVVLDSYSTDGTAELCTQLGAQVFQQEFESFTKQKNTALDKVTGEWALSLDADETLSPELAAEISQAVQDNRYDGYELARVNDFLGKRMYHSGIKKEYILRLVRRDKARFEGGKVHEKLVVHGKTTRLKNVFVHHPYDDIETYFAKFNKYTTLAAQTMYENGQSICLVRTILTVPFEFARRYILKAGFLDGMRGLIWASFSCFYVFVKHMKLWYLRQQDRSR